MYKIYKENRVLTHSTAIRTIMCGFQWYFTWLQQQGMHDEHLHFYVCEHETTLDFLIDTIGAPTENLW